MRPDRTAKSIGFSVWRISPNVQRIHRKKRKTPRKSATGTSRARERGSTAGRSALPQRRPPVRARNASGSASRAMGTWKNDESSQPGVAASTRPTGTAKESAASARESGSALSPRKRRASTAAPDAPARRRTKAKRSAVGTVTNGFKVAQRDAPHRLTLEGMVADSPRVAVIGGGLAGLVAADRLLGGGHPRHGLREVPRGRRPRRSRRRGRDASRALLPPPLHERRRLRVVRRGVRPRAGPRLAQVADGFLLGRPALRLRDARPRSSPSRRSESRAASSSSSRRSSSATIPTGRSSEPETAKGWMRRNGYGRALDVVWGPLLDQKYGRRADEVGLVWLWGKIALRTRSRDKTGLGERLGYLKGSFGRGVEAPCSSA